MPDQITTALDQIREANRSLDATNVPSWGTMPKIRRVVTGSDRLLAALDAVLALHQPFRIYDECDHDHTEEDIAEGLAVDTGEFVSCHDEYLYSICMECCVDAQCFQTEECAGAHVHDVTHCHTVLVVSRALLGEDGT